jgi:hypothetical protein
LQIILALGNFLIVFSSINLYFSQLFDLTHKQFTSLKSRKAFVEQFRKCHLFADNDLFSGGAEFAVCEESLINVIDNYEQCAKGNLMRFGN